MKNRKSKLRKYRILNKYIFMNRLKLLEEITTIRAENIFLKKWLAEFYGIGKITN